MPIPSHPPLPLSKWACTTLPSVLCSLACSVRALITHLQLIDLIYATSPVNTYLYGLVTYQFIVYGSTSMSSLIPLVFH
jgi:hypothetical protein